MTFGTVIQARMGSTRFPGKTLYTLKGRPLLGMVLDSLRLCRFPNALVVATSEHPSDDLVETFCKEEGVQCVRGPLDDVAGRIALALDGRDWDAFVRISADSPLLDYRLVDHAVDLFEKRHPCLVTNVLERTFPKGQSVEVLSVAVFLSALFHMTQPDEREHVTRYFYSNPGMYRIVDFRMTPPRGDMCLCVDTPDDMANIENILAHMDRPHTTYTVADILQITDEMVDESV